MYHVYKLTFQETEMFYIGQTINVSKRFERHISSLKGNYHHNRFLQRWFNKHKPVVYNIEILQSFDSKNDCNAYEELLITETYSSNFNISKKATGGDVISYHPCNDEIRQKHRENYFNKGGACLRFRNIDKSGSLNPNYKHGRYSNEAKSSAKCKVCDNVSVKSIGAMCKDCLSKYRSDNAVGEKNSFFGKTHSEETKAKLSKFRKEFYTEGNLPKNARKVLADGILFNSCSECAEHYGISKGLVNYRIKSDNWNFEYAL